MAVLTYPKNGSPAALDRRDGALCVCIKDNDDDLQYTESAADRKP